MFQHVLAINELLLDLFVRVSEDLPEERLFHPSPGHGHSPAWIMGHLATTGEMGIRLLGGKIEHVRWLKLFGPGSTDQVPDDGSLSKSDLVNSTVQCYRQLRERTLLADPAGLNAPHSVELLQGTPIRTQGDLLAHLLSSHFAIHLSQLSSCRRSEGHRALF